MEVWLRREEKGRATGRLSCCTSGRMLLKIQGAPALFRKQKKWIYPDLELQRETSTTYMIAFIQNSNLSNAFFGKPLVCISWTNLGCYVNIWSQDISKERNIALSFGCRLYNGCWKPKVELCLVAWRVFQSLPIKLYKLTSAIIVKMVCHPAAQTAGREREICWRRL